MWWRALVLSALCLWPATSFAQVAFDAAGSTVGAGVTSLSFSLTTSGSNRVLLGSSQIYTNTESITGMTYNGAALTDIASSTTGGTASTMTVNQRYRVAPSTGANTFQCTYSGTSSFEVFCAAVSMTGVDQSTPIGTAVTQFGVSTTPSVTVTSEANGLVVDSVAIEYFGALSVGAGQSQRWNDVGSGGYLKHAGSTEPGAASVTMSWSYGTSTNWANIATPFKPVAVAASAVPLGTLLGVGQ